MSIARKINLMVLLVLPATFEITAQNTITVTGKPFAINSKNSTYSEMSKKLPQLICSGILYNSALQFDPIGLTEPSFSDVTAHTGRRDSVYLNVKPLIDGKKIQFFLEGEMHIINDLFYLNISGTNFDQPLIPYRSQIQPLTQFQKIIDEASENLNYQMRTMISGVATTSIQVTNFRFKYPRNFKAASRDVLTPDFPAKFLAYNLKSSKQFQILPYEYSLDKKFGRVKPGATITGIVNLDNKGHCVVRSVLYWRGDSLTLMNVKGIIQTRDDILERILSNVQSVLNAIAENGGLAAFKARIQGYSGNDFKDAFESALKNNNPSLANYFADQFSAASPKNKKSALLLKSRIYYSMEDYNAALDLVNEYLKGDDVAEEGHYFAALSNIKLSNYDAAKSALKKINKNSPTFKDVRFHMGVCLYGQDSIHKALDLFKEQKSIDPSANPEVYAYAGTCYRILGNWAAAEENFVALYNSEPGNTTYKNYLRDFYDNYALELTTRNNDEEAYQYLMKSYHLTKNHESLILAIEAILKLRKPDDVINAHIEKGLADQVFDKSNIYYDLAEMCRYQVDSNNNFIPHYLNLATRFLKQHSENIAGKGNKAELSTIYSRLGSTFFRLKNLDSAVYYYQKAKETDRENGINFFNLAEAQLMLLKPTEALKTLEEAKQKFLQSSKETNYYYLGLYYFYAIESKILLGADYSAEVNKLKEIIKIHAPGEKIFAVWSFRTFYNWAKNLETIPTATKNKLLNHLCEAIAYSQDAGRGLCSEKVANARN